MLKISVAVLMLLFSSLVAKAESITILALGDSLTAGYGLDPNKSFAAKLETALKAKGHNVVVINGGVSGDTVAQGAARLDWSLTDDVDAVLVELGANDAMRGLPTDQAAKALDEILTKLKSRNLPMLLLGMRSPPNMGPDYANAFESIYTTLSAKHEAALYPFFLEGVAANASLNQADGIHPNAQGVDVIVARVLPDVEALLARVK